MQLAFGLVRNVVTKLLEPHMISSFSAKITVDAKEKTKAIFDSINTDNEFYPENPTKTHMSLNDKITISIESDHIPHLRANLNSTLRLIQASYDSIESVKI
jgi:KEOPS complex subunit Pcc1